MRQEQEAASEPPLEGPKSVSRPTWLWDASIHVVAYGPLLVAAIVVFAWLVIARTVGPETFPEWGTYAFLSLAAFVAGLGGLGQLVRREAPGFRFGDSFHGVWPVVSGALWLGSCWVFAVLLVLSAIQAQ